MRSFYYLGFLSLFWAPCLVFANSAESNSIDTSTNDSASYELLNRENACIALGTCPGTEKRDDDDDDDDDEDRTKCSPDKCPKYCQTETSEKRTFLGGPTSNSLRALHKRFLEPSKPGRIAYDLQGQSYTKNLGVPELRFDWKEFDNNEYASVIEGLCGCTAIIAASSKGIFTAHLWEEDKVQPPRDLQPANYEKTTSELRDQLSSHKDALADGEVFIMMPSRTNNGKKELYASDIVNAIKNAVKDGSGLDPETGLYVPLDCENSPVLGTNERGTIATQYDPKYKPDEDSESKRAYRLWIFEGKEPKSEKIL